MGQPTGYVPSIASGIGEPPAVFSAAITGERDNGNTWTGDYIKRTPLVQILQHSRLVRSDQYESHEPNQEHSKDHQVRSSQLLNQQLYLSSLCRQHLRGPPTRPRFSPDDVPLPEAGTEAATR